MKAALLALVMALPAVSAPWVCTVVSPAAPPTVRAEAMTELLPDVVITRAGGDIQCLSGKQHHEPHHRCDYRPFRSHADNRRAGTRPHFRFSENFPGAFKTRTGANSESGFYSGFAAADRVAGLADYGTRLKAIFRGVPAGVRLFVSTTDLAGNSAVLVPDESFVGTLPAASPTAVAELPVANSTAAAVWDVVNADPNVVESLAFGVWQQFSNTPPPSTVRVSLSYAPTPTNGAFTTKDGTIASATLPLPRFVDTSRPLKLFTIVPCGFHPAR